MEEEYEVKMAQLGKIEANVQQMIRERKQKSQDINDTLNHSKAEADKEMADSQQVLTALKRSVEKCVQEKLKSTEKAADGLIKELGLEIEDLTNISSEVKQLSHTKDHLHLLQTFRSLKDPPPAGTGQRWSSVLRLIRDTEQGDEEAGCPRANAKEVFSVYYGGGERGRGSYL
ncbi:unnamed protein product [Arctogadus glacialis]